MSLAKDKPSVKDSQTGNEVNLELINRLFLAPKMKAPTRIIPNDEAVVIHLTDWHTGKLVVDVEGKQVFNLAIAKARAENLCEQVLYLIKQHILEGTKISRIIIFITGDMADGEGIYEGQSSNLEITPPKQVITCAGVLISLFKALLALKMPIEVYAVKGNHGQAGKNCASTSNWDLMLYMILELWARESGIRNFSIRYSETDFLRVVVNGWKYLLRHQGANTTETPSGASRTYGWQMLHDIDAVVYGHLHHPAIGQLGRIRTFMGGSLPGVDDFSERLGKGAAPCQLVWGVSKKHLSTFIYLVELA